MWSFEFHIDVLLCMAHSKGQGHGHAHLNCEYLANRDKSQTLILPTNKVSYGLLIS